MLSAYGIEAQHPDEFAVHLLNLAPEKVLEAAHEHRISLRNPPKSETEYIESLERQGLRETVAILRTLLIGH